MKKYGVVMTYYKYVEVEANNREEALNKAHAGEVIKDDGLIADDKSFNEVEEIDN